MQEGCTLGMMESHVFSSINQVYEFVLGFVNVEKGQSTDFKLDRMRELARRLGNPHLGRLTVHVAGSKGKGSVATLIAGALEASGIPTGLYTSPHHLSWEERITRAGRALPDRVILQAAEEVYRLVAGKPPSDFPGNELPTYFELTTLIGFCAFRLAGMQAQVIEVGMGGRLDSTNIVEPDVCAITPVELEHTQYLGNTIPLIAAEKAGIIKEGIPVCALQRHDDALEVIEKTAAEKQAPLLVAGRHIEIRDVRVTLEGTSCMLMPTEVSPPALQAFLSEEGMPVRTGFIGSVYAYNMALAVLVLASLDRPIDREAILKGFMVARLPARFEVVSRKPLVVLDGAHTPDSIASVIRDFTALSGYGKKVLLFGCAIDKHHEEMAAMLAPHFDDIIVTRPGSFKQSDPEAVFQSFRKHAPQTRFVPDTEDAIALARSILSSLSACRHETDAQPLGSSMLVTGSFYLCAEYEKTIRAE